MDLPIENGGLFHSYVSLPEGTNFQYSVILGFLPLQFPSLTSRREVVTKFLSDVFIPIEAAEKKTHQSSDAAVLIFGDNFSPVVLLKSLAENPNISGVKIPTVLGIPIFT